MLVPCERRNKYQLITVKPSLPEETRLIRVIFGYMIELVFLKTLAKGNTVGSLSKVQQSLVLGCMLGDGYMRCKTNAHLQVTHSHHQREYVDWKYSLLNEYVLTPPKYYQGNGNRVGYRFFTRSLPVFTSFYHRFYLRKKKIIPEDLTLTPLALAVWFMDDGSKSRKSYYLNTQQFSSTEQSHMVDVLLRDFGLYARCDRDKQYTRLRFPVDSSKRLAQIIESLVIPSMQYKLLI